MMVATLLLTVLACPGQDLDRLVEQLSDDSIERREAAVLALSRLGGAARLRLLPLRASSDPELARRACRTVGLIDWEPYLPAHGRPADVVTWEQLGSPDSEIFVVGFQKIVSDAKQGLGLLRKFRDEPSDDRKQLYLPHIGSSTCDPELLYRWAEELPENTFWGGAGDYGDQILYFFRDEEKPFRRDFWKRFLRDSNRSRRLLAALIMGWRDDKDGLDALIDFVDDADWYVSDRAIAVLRNKKYAPAREKFLAVATKQNGQMNAFYGMEQFGWAGAAENLRKIAADGDDRKMESVHRELLKIGDRSFLPGLIDKLKSGKGSLIWGRGTVAAALLYDTPESVEAVLDRFSRVDFWGAHRMEEHFTFGPNGTRLLWDRFVGECREGVKDPKCGMYVYHFADPSLLTDRIREALNGDPPERLKTQCFELLFRWGLKHPLAPVDLDLLRSRGQGNPRAEAMLLDRKDRPFREILLRRLEKEPTAPTLGALQSYDDPDLNDLFLKYSDKSFSPDIRAAAMKNFSRFGANGLPLLLAALTDAHPPIREAALSALSAFSPRLFKDQADVLERAFRISQPYYGSKALACLAVVDPRRAGLIAREVLKGAPTIPYLPEAALKVIARQVEPGDGDLARPYASNPQPDIFLPAVEILIELRSEDAWAAVRSAALDRNEARRRAALSLLGRCRRPEAGPILIQAALTDAYPAAEVAVESLARMGGADAEAFVRRCADDADRGRPTPASWPVAAAMLRADALLPSLYRRLDRSPDRLALWAVDVLIHRDGYAALPTSPEEMAYPSSFSEAAHAMARRHRVEAWVSPALEASIRKKAKEHESAEADRITPRFDLELRPELHETLRLWKPRVESWHFSDYGGGGWIEELSWGHVLEGNTLLFLTPEETRQRLKAARK